MLVEQGASIFQTFDYYRFLLSKFTKLFLVRIEKL